MAKVLSSPNRFDIEKIKNKKRGNSKMFEKKIAKTQWDMIKKVIKSLAISFAIDMYLMCQLFQLFFTNLRSKWKKITMFRLKKKNKKLKEKRGKEERKRRKKDRVENYV